MTDSSITLEVLHSGQKSIQDELKDFKKQMIAWHLRSDVRIDAIDNPKNGALVQIRRDQDRQSRRILLTIITAIIAILCVIIAAYFSRFAAASINTQRPARSSFAPASQQGQHEQGKIGIH